MTLAMDDLMGVEEIRVGNAASSLIVTMLGMAVWMDADQGSAPIGMASLFRAGWACAPGFAIPIGSQFVGHGWIDWRC